MTDSKKKKKGISRRSFLGGTGAVALSSLLGSKEAVSGIRSQGESSTGSSQRNDSEITHAAIYPGIGVARIGNSKAEEDYFIGPEVVEPPPTGHGKTRDFNGAIKRQAARFRIYGYNAAGEVVRELTADEADIQWSVHLANKKAEWFRFYVALDIPEAKATSCPKRNADVKGSARLSLILDPGARSISGRAKSGREFLFDGLSFMGKPISTGERGPDGRELPFTLGELRTDGKGRLLVLGGLGHSGSPERKLVFDSGDWDTFNNADGWYDDIADGPVSARVKIGGKEIPVESGWVIVGPPNFTPDVISWRTMYDLLVDTYVTKGVANGKKMPMPTKTSFTNDVLPLLRRLTNLQWVNKGFADLFGAGTKLNFDDPEFIAQLADPSRKDLRIQLVNSFRGKGQDANNPRLWPQLYGDAYGSFENTPAINFQVHDLSDAHLRRWAEGNYVNDWNPAQKPYRRLSDVPLAEQPAMLTKAALHFCAADAFHPGCELTWPMRHGSMYRDFFRIKDQSPVEDSSKYGDALTQTNVLGPKGPLNSQGPGDLTKWMALPWQGDTVFCRSGYDPEFHPYLSTYWPARVPNHVLSEADYAIVMSPDPQVTREQRVAAFQKRVFWVRPLKGSPPDQIQQMVDGFERMGVVEARPGLPNDPVIPSIIFVETPPLPTPVAANVPASAPASKSGSGGNVRSAPNNAGLSDEEKRIRQAGWESKEQFEAFRRRFRTQK